jgi:hypothetical protein
MKLGNHILDRDTKPEESVLLEYIRCSSPRAKKQNKAYDGN